MDILNDRQRARASLKMGKWIMMRAETRFTTSGLLGVAVLVSAILLSTSVIVAAATKRRP